MELHLHPHFDTHMDPSCGLHKATNHILYWIGTAKPMVPKKGQQCGNTGLPLVDKPVLPRGTYREPHVADIRQPSPSKHDKTGISLRVHNSGTTQLLAF